MSRGFFISSTGFMAIGPLAGEKGDIICILPAWNVPLIIRKMDDCYFLFGECFVWGLMNGEGTNRGLGLGYEVFRLR